MAQEQADYAPSPVMIAALAAACRDFRTVAAAGDQIVAALSSLGGAVTLPDLHAAGDMKRVCAHEAQLVAPKRRSK